MQHACIRVTLRSNLDALKICKEKLVFQVLELCEKKDIVDAMSDLETVLLILQERFQKHCDKVRR